jgi:hypothetical protein
VPGEVEVDFRVIVAGHGDASRIEWLKPNIEKPRERGYEREIMSPAEPAVNGGPNTAGAGSPVNGAGFNSRAHNCDPAQPEDTLPHRLREIPLQTPDRRVA